MKYKNILIVVCYVLLNIANVKAQVAQRGFVKEYNGRAEKTPLENVALIVNNAGSTMTDENGEFLLQFRTLKPGAKVKIEEIYKDGYELLNPDVVSQWYISRDDHPYTLVMCQSRRIKELKDKYAKTSSESYARQQKLEEEQLAKERDAGKLKGTEYQLKIEELRNIYAQKMEDIHSYFEKFARIDLSELSDVEAKILELIQEGDIDTAIEKYDELDIGNKMKSISEKIRKEDTFITELSEEKNKDLISRDSLFHIFMRSINTRAMAGGAENFKAIGEKLKISADNDTTYYKPSKAYAEYLFSQKLFSESLKYFNIAARHVNETEHSQLNAIYWQMASAQRELQQYAEAEPLYFKAFSYIDYNVEDSALCLYQTSSLWSEIAMNFFFLGNIDSCFDYYSRALSAAKIAAQKDEKYKTWPWVVRLNIADAYLQLDMYDKADSLYTLSLNHFEKFPSDDNKEMILMAELGLARSQMSQGNFKGAELPLQKWLSAKKEEFINNPVAKEDQVIISQIMLLEVYAYTKQISKLNTLKGEIEKELEEYMEINPELYRPIYLTYKTTFAELLLDYGNKYCGYIIHSMKDTYENILNWQNSNANIYFRIKCSIIIGIAYTKIGNMVEFENWTKRGINLLDSLTNVDAPFLEEVLESCYNLGQYYYQIDNVDEAESYLKRYLSDSDYDMEKYGKEITNSFEMLEDIFIKQERYENALGCVQNIRLLNNEIDVHDKDAMLYLSEAKILLELNRKKEARAAYKKAVECDKNYVNEHGKELRKILYGK